MSDQFAGTAIILIVAGIFTFLGGDAMDSDFGKAIACLSIAVGIVCAVIAVWVPA
jgi:uncharacterized PurR-regulated membrane protein YhhQ (DUF165 family)